MKYTFVACNVFVLIISLAVAALSATTLLNPALPPESVVQHFPEVLPATVAVCGLGSLGIFLTLINWVVLWSRRKRLIRTVRGLIFVSVTIDYSVAAVCMYLWYRCRRWVVTNDNCETCGDDVTGMFLLLLPATCGLVICSVPKVACFVMMHSLRGGDAGRHDYTIPRLTYRRTMTSSASPQALSSSYMTSSESLDAAVSSRQNLLPKRISTASVPPKPITSPSAKNHIITQAAKNAVAADPKFTWLRQGSKRSFSPISPEYIEQLRMKSLDKRLTGTSLPKLPTSGPTGAEGEVANNTSTVSKQQDDVTRSMPNIVTSCASNADVTDGESGTKPLKGILKTDSLKEDLGSEKQLDNSGSTHLGSNTSTDKLLGSASIQVSQCLYV